jgi:hypothetical protein
MHASVNDFEKVLGNMRGSASLARQDSPLYAAYLADAIDKIGDIGEAIAFWNAHRHDSQLHREDLPVFSKTLAIKLQDEALVEWNDVLPQLSKITGTDVLDLDYYRPMMKVLSMVTHLDLLRAEAETDTAFRFHLASSIAKQQMEDPEFLWRMVEQKRLDSLEGDVQDFDMLLEDALRLVPEKMYRRLATELLMYQYGPTKHYAFGRFQFPTAIKNASAWYTAEWMVVLRQIAANQFI